MVDNVGPAAVFLLFAEPLSDVVVCNCAASDCLKAPKSAIVRKTKLSTRKKPSERPPIDQWKKIGKK